MKALAFVGVFRVTSPNGPCRPANPKPLEPMAIHPILFTNADSWQEELRRAALALLYKHSSICGVSAAASEEVERFADANPTLPIFRVDVIRERGVSQRIAEHLGVRHASPQAILLRCGSPIWVTSHLGVTAAALEDATRSAGEAGLEPFAEPGPNVPRASTT